MLPNLFCSVTLLLSMPSQWWFSSDFLKMVICDQQAVLFQRGTNRDVEGSCYMGYLCCYWEAVEWWQKAICCNWTNDVNGRVNLFNSKFSIKKDVIQTTNHISWRNSRCPNCSRSYSQSKHAFLTDGEQLAFHFSTRFFTSREKKNGIRRIIYVRLKIKKNSVWVLHIKTHHFRGQNYDRRTYLALETTCVVSLVGWFPSASNFCNYRWKYFFSTVSPSVTTYNVSTPDFKGIYMLDL